MLVDFLSPKGYVIAQHIIEKVALKKETVRTESYFLVEKSF